MYALLVGLELNRSNTAYSGQRGGQHIELACIIARDRQRNLLGEVGTTHRNGNHLLLIKARGGHNLCGICRKQWQVVASPRDIINEVGGGTGCSAIARETERHKESIGDSGLPRQIDLKIEPIAGLVLGGRHLNLQILLEHIRRVGGIDIVELQLGGLTVTDIVATHTERKDLICSVLVVKRRRYEPHLIQRGVGLPPDVCCCLSTTLLVVIGVGIAPPRTSTLQNYILPSLQAESTVVRNGIEILTKQRERSGGVPNKIGCPIGGRGVCLSGRTRDGQGLSSAASRAEGDSSGVGTCLGGIEGEAQFALRVAREQG